MSKADELKSKNENLFQRNSILINQLIEAKSIIQSFVWWHTDEDRGSINSVDLVEQAKQFLSEAVK